MPFTYYCKNKSCPFNKKLQEASTLLLETDKLHAGFPPCIKCGTVSGRIDICTKHNRTLFVMYSRSVKDSCKICRTEKMSDYIVGYCIFKDNSTITLVPFITLIGETKNVMQNICRITDENALKNIELIKQTPVTDCFLLTGMSFKEAVDFMTDEID